MLGLMTPHKELTGVPDKDYRGPQQGLPGCPTKTTGVPDKNYRGVRQGLPGCPTKTTGVPNKLLSLKVLQNGVFRVTFWRLLVFVYLVNVMLFNNNYRENGEDNPWEPIASS
jgi:hypothetical protein